MHLKTLQISGFKSFARKTRLEFTPGITAIVGPNGSGKSNVADAIRWVMGEQSIKTLRGKKSEDVIFSGSDKKARLGLAEVSLGLDNSDKKVPVDYSELEITRKIYRSGDSDYLINNNKSKLGEINLLLTKANFGHRTYSVIGQGMIDNFLIATPQERKEFFDEASGVKQYQIKKNQSLKKLEAVWQNLVTVKIKIQEMEPQLKLLTRQVKKLKKRKEIEASLGQLKLKFYGSWWREINQKYLENKNDIDVLMDKKNSAESIYLDSEKQINSIASKNNPNRDIENLRQTQRSLMDQKMKLREEIIQSRVSAINPYKTKIEKIKNISRDELILISGEFKQISLLHQKIIQQIEAGAEIDLIKVEISNINQKIEQIIKKIHPYIKQVSSAKTEIEPLKQDVQIKKKEQNVIKLEKEIENIQLKINQLNIEDDQSRSSLIQIQKKYQQAQTELNKINNLISEKRIDLARVETKRFDLKKEIETEIGDFENINKFKIDKISVEEKNAIFIKIKKFKSQLDIIGGIDPETEAEYETVNQRYNFLKNQTEDLEQTIKSLKKIIDRLDKTIKSKMEASFKGINSYFKKYFKTLFNGGKAELVLIKEKEIKKKSTEMGEEDVGAELAPAHGKATASVAPTITDEDEENEKTAINFFQEKSKQAAYAGIEVQATPPGKRLKSINSLSGGERALTSIALICAIISTNPSPFVVLDEVDAALDEANSIRFAAILEELSKKTQFVVITHNRATMEKANILYGVTMGDDGISKLISINLEQAEESINNKEPNKNIAT